MTAFVRRLLTRPLATARRPKVKLSAVELERRDTPAWWTVAAPASPDGTPGSTAATHSGQLAVSPAYVPDSTTGQVSVFANTAAEAVAQGLFGTIQVTLGGQVADYTFEPDAVGTNAAEHKPFLVTVTGSSVTVAFEDMAGQPGCDYDYNDRTWSGASASPSASPVIWQQTDVWTSGSGNVTVTMKVTDEGPVGFKWSYHLHNDSYLYVRPYEEQGVRIFSVHIADPSVVLSGGTNIADRWAFGTPNGSGVSWYIQEGDELAPGILPEGEGDFWLITPPTLINPEAGNGWEQGLAESVNGFTVTSDHWPGMDDVVIFESFVSVGDSFENIQQVIDAYSVFAPAKSLLDEAIRDGVQILKGPAQTGGDYEPETKKIFIDPKNTTSLDDAVSALLFELLRHKYRDDQLALDNKVAKSGPAAPYSRDEYATDCEKLTYEKIVKDHSSFAKIGTSLATPAANRWGTAVDQYTNKIKPGGVADSFAKYLDIAKGNGHYDRFRLDRYSKIKPIIIP